LHITIHYDDRLTSGMVNPCGDRRLMAEIAAQVQRYHMPIEAMQFLDKSGSAIPTPVVDEDDLVRQAQGAQNNIQPAVKLAYVLLLIIEWDRDAHDWETVFRLDLTIHG
jgi:hypothetical protein